MTVDNSKRYRLFNTVLDLDRDIIGVRFLKTEEDYLA